MKSEQIRPTFTVPEKTVTFFGVKPVVPSFTLKMRKSHKKLARVYAYTPAYTQIRDGGGIPHICYFLYTGKIFQAKILHPKARKLRQIGFRDKMHKSWFIGTNTNCRSRSVGGHNNVFDILKNTRCQITNRE